MQRRYGAILSPVPRAIVRYSFDSKGVQSRNEIRDALMAAGFTKIGTATYEGTGPSIATLVKALRKCLAVAGRPPQGSLDHLWIYLDQGP